MKGIVLRISKIQKHFCGWPLSRVIGDLIIHRKELRSLRVDMIYYIFSRSTLSGLPGIRGFIILTDYNLIRKWLNGGTVPPNSTHLGGTLLEMFPGMTHHSGIHY